MNNNNTFIQKLKSSGLRPTRQRINICKALFNRKNTFHFTIKDLIKILADEFNIKISVATIYNTIHSFKKKGYLKEISINSDQSYFDTNVSNHHHFFNESTNELIDLNDKDLENVKIKKKIPGKKIKSIELLVKVANNN